MLTQALNRADEWRAAHQDHIWKILAEAGGKVRAVQPSDSDLLHPHLWKAMHWEWYFQHRD